MATQSGVPLPCTELGLPMEDEAGSTSVPCPLSQLSRKSEICCQVQFFILLRSAVQQCFPAFCTLAPAASRPRRLPACSERRFAVAAWKISWEDGGSTRRNVDAAPLTSTECLILTRDDLTASSWSSDQCDHRDQPFDGLPKNSGAGS